MDKFTHSFFISLLFLYTFSIIDMVIYMKKITFLIKHLGYGGITKTTITLANLLVQKFDVEIIATFKLYSESPYTIDEKVSLKYLIEDLKPNKKEVDFYKGNKNYSKYFKELFKSVKIRALSDRLMIKTIKNLDSDVVITTRSYYNYLVSKYAPENVRKIAWEHLHHNNDIKYINKLVESCENINSLVLVSNELKDFYKEKLGKKVEFIPNCLENVSRKLSKLDTLNIVSSGRLAKEKGFDDLLKVFKKVSNKFPEAKLNIVGDGMERNNLLELAKELKLGEKVEFHGYQNNEYINELLQDSSLYVMTSLTESFGLGLIEAMNYGIPCISYSSAQGANEIIRNEENGYIIQDRNEEEMINKICLVLEDEKLRKKLGKQARETAKEYSSDVVLDKWIKLINKRK